MLTAGSFHNSIGKVLWLKDKLPKVKEWDEAIYFLIHAVCLTSINKYEQKFK